MYYTEYLCLKKKINLVILMPIWLVATFCFHILCLLISVEKEAYEEVEAKEEEDEGKVTEP